MIRIWNVERCIMDEKDIEIFRSLIQTGNITKSSEKLYTTQSSLTKRIQKMEEELGCQLFIRTKKGVLPTPAAEKICPISIISRKPWTVSGTSPSPQKVPLPVLSTSVCR